MKKKSTLVFSSELGKICSGCEKEIAKCICNIKNPTLDGDGIIKIKKETKKRRGKTVTVISGFNITLDELKVLAKKLKSQLGAGGTIKMGTLEIQGDYILKSKEILRKLGFKVE